MEPLKFNALLKSTIWGGEKIIPFKHLDVQQENVGESWEISGVPGNETVVANGEYAGKKLNELVHELKGKLVGEANYQRFGDEFPLLIKFIDARQDLSIQVHPTDEIAKRQGKERGKTEMWYLLPSDADATLLCGLKQQITPTQYAEMVENDTICDAISRYDVKEGDCFFLPAGRIHAIGTGCFLAEIQQTSDVQQENVGESWEISGVPGNETVVANGEYAGKKLNELVHELKGKLVGEANYQRFGDEFPLLIKFIDARQDLSIQVHPTDEIAKRQGKERGKTEMWYLLPSDADATLLCGLKQQITPTQYAEMVENDTICDAISRYDVKEGDCFFLPAGRIHAIGTSTCSRKT